MEAEELIWTQRYTDYLENKPARAARIVFQRDRARVIHSAAFRRLQAKTQIFGLNESDFFRTRLTHSMEVAQIGSGLVEQLITIGVENGIEQDYVRWLPSTYLIEAICLAHDLGHPPFGHGGEVALNYMMRDYGGFEGNAQTLRILAKLGESTFKNGLDLSRRTALGVVKYPAVYDEVIGLNPDYLKQLTEPTVDDFRVLEMERWIPPKAIFKEEVELLQWVLQPFSASDRAHFTDLSVQASGSYIPSNGHAKTLHKSLDTTIMELADDIAYGIHDLEDAIAMRMVTRDMWQKQVMNSEVFQRYGLWGDDITEHLFSGSSKGCKYAISEMVGTMVESIYIDKNAEFEHPLLAYQAKLSEGASRVLELLKKFVFDNVITIAQVKQMEYKGQLIVLELFKSLRANPSALMPKKHFLKMQQQDSEQQRQRIICDYIAGMTNTYAARLYSKLFTPSQGSIFDLL